MSVTTLCSRLTCLFGVLLLPAVGHAQVDGLPMVPMSEFVSADDAAPSDLNGGSVALQGDTLVSGSRGSDGSATNGGAAYVFAQSIGGGGGTGGFNQVQKLTASGTEANDEFGTTIAISGVRLAISAPRAAIMGEEKAGRVVLFTFNGGSWIESAVVSAPTPQADAGFGVAVALDDRTLAVGVPGHDTAIRNEGQVHLYVFDEKSATWHLDATLVAPDSGENDRFGFTLDLAGDLLVVGVEADDDAGIDAGAAWVFRRTDGTWAPETKLRGTDGEWYARFGSAVAIDDAASTIAVGAERSDVFGVDDGAVMLFERDDTTSSWLPGQVLGAVGDPAARELGGSLDFDGDRLVVGMPVSDDPATDCGGGMLYRRDGTGQWSQEASLQASGAGELELFGHAVAASAGRIAVGRPLSGTDDAWTGDVLTLDLNEDCNENDVPDPIDLAAGDAFDSNQNGVLDVCECFGDLNLDDRVDGADLSILLGYWGTSPKNLPEADIDGDGTVTGGDLSILLGYWGSCG